MVPVNPLASDRDVPGAGPVVRPSGTTLTARPRVRVQHAAMNAGLSIHVVDVSRGTVARGLEVRVERLIGAGREFIVQDRTGERGTLAALEPLADRFAAGVHEATFHIGAWYAAQGVALPDVPFLDVVSYRFGITDTAQHYHLPFKMTPWGFSYFRGGA